jgi:sugar phosphate isomerase/epimerase
MSKSWRAHFIFMRKVSFALGSIHTWSDRTGRGSLLKFAKKLDIDGVEITFARKDDALNFELSKSDIRFLRGLDYVSIHAPFKLVRDNSEEDIIEILKKIDYVYRKVGAKNVVIHPLDIPEQTVLRKFRFNVITENLPKRLKKDHKIITLDDVFKKYPNIGLCLDVSHAYRISSRETGRIVTKFGGRIRQIHFSGTYRDDDHLQLKYVTKDFYKSIEPILKIDAPIVIEEFFEKKDIKKVKEEVSFVRKLFLQ